MTIYDLRCDRCGRALSGPSWSDAFPGARGVRFRYHPGVPALGDDAGLLCEPCWDEASAWLGSQHVDRCGHCGRALHAEPFLAVATVGDLTGWLLCTADALAFLNSLRTVDPKLDPATFQLPSADTPVRLRNRSEGAK